MTVTNQAENMRNDWQGFTVVESVLVLLLVTIFLFWPMVTFDRWQKKFEIDQYLLNFEKNIAFTQQLSIVGGRDTAIYFENQAILFQVNHQKLNKKMTLPKNITVEAPQKIIFKKNSGNSGYLKKIIFYSEQQQRKVVFQFQMGSVYLLYINSLVCIYHKVTTKL